MTAADTLSDLDFVLSLVARERKARNSPLWKTDTEAAFEDHGAACDALWEELYRLLDVRDGIGEPVKASKPTRPELIKRHLRAEMKTELRRCLPGIIDEAVNSL